jgi:hypothetical protein
MSNIEIDLSRDSRRGHRPRDRVSCLQNDKWIMSSSNTKERRTVQLRSHCECQMLRSLYLTSQRLACCPAHNWTNQFSPWIYTLPVGISTENWYLANTRARRVHMQGYLVTAVTKTKCPLITRFVFELLSCVFSSASVASTNTHSWQYKRWICDGVLFKHQFTIMVSGTLMIDVTQLGHSGLHFDDSE